MTFEILEIDRDYHAISGIELKQFESKAAADEWCRKESWTGYHYLASAMSSQQGNTP